MISSELLLICLPPKNPLCYEANLIPEFICEKCAFIDERNTGFAASALADAAFCHALCPIACFRGY